MKNVIISALILTLIIILLTLNAFALSKASKQLTTLAENDDIDALSDYWERLEPYVSICVAHLETESVTKALSQMRSYAQSNNLTEYEAAKQIFKEAVEHIKFSGILSFETIL